MSIVIGPSRIDADERPIKVEKAMEGRVNMRPIITVKDALETLWHDPANLVAALPMGTTFWDASQWIQRALPPVEAWPAWHRNLLLGYVQAKQEGHPVWGPGQRELWGRKQVYGFMKPASEAAGLRCYVDPVSNTHNRFPLIDVLSVLANDYRVSNTHHRFPLIDVLSVLANDYRATVVQALHGWSRLQPRSLADWRRLWGCG